MELSRAGNSLVAMALGALTLALSAGAAEKGDMILGVRAIYVSAGGDSDITVINGDVDVDNDIVPEVSLTYFLTDRVAVELMAATTQNDITASGTILGDVDLGDIRLLPPTLTLQYHLPLTERARAYAGAGINYTVFYDDDLPNGGAVTSIDYENTFGLVLQVGIAYELSEHWVANLDVKRIFLDTEVDITAGALVDADVDLDPWIVGAGIGYRF